MSIPFISEAFAQAAPAATASESPFGAITSMLPLVLMFVVLYFVMIRPQMKRQKEAKAMIEALAKGDEIVTAGGMLAKIKQAGADDRVQDPYSFRCQPQVMGACLDLLAQAARMLTIEANAVSDNPLVFAEDGAVLSGGNFHAEPVAFAADMTAMAIAEIGSLSERRIAALIDSSISLLPPFLIRNPGLNSGFMIPQCTAAALMSENKQMSHPASVDSAPTSANQEDHVSMATHGARRLGPMNANLARIIAIELMAAAEGLEFRRPLLSSAMLEEAHAVIRGKAARRDEDREFATDTEALAELIAQGGFTRFVPGLLAELGCR